MASKRSRYVSENELSSSDFESNDDSQSLKKRSKISTKWLSRNAIMARENRQKKKLYISSLERDVQSLKTDNVKMRKIVGNQSGLISDLRKEIKYLKSVIANSGDISNLIRNIRQSTGMSVRSSLDQNLSQHFSKPQIASKTAFPWEHQFDENPTKTVTSLLDSDFKLDDLLGDAALFQDLDHFEPESEHLEEHNYNCHSATDEDDVGVCLHVSKHRVSLEFCQVCSENATQPQPDL